MLDGALKATTHELPHKLLMQSAYPMAFYKNLVNIIFSWQAFNPMPYYFTLPTPHTYKNK
jgi:hypothetical protein